MAVIEYWIQIENHPWDLCPNPKNIDRMTGKPPNPLDPTNYLSEHLPAGKVNASPIRQQHGKDVFVDPPKKALYLQLFHSLGHNMEIRLS